jgi:hypothetical protein
VGADLKANTPSTVYAVVLVVLFSHLKNTSIFILIILQTDMNPCLRHTYMQVIENK